jgi:hypothetical protein
MKFLPQPSVTVFTPSLWREIWVGFKYSLFPSEEKYLLLEWCLYHRKGWARRWPTVMDFLDERVGRIRVNVKDEKTGTESKIIGTSFLQAILNEHTRPGIIEFLEKPLISVDDIKAAQRVMRRAWRMSAEEAGVRAEPPGKSAGFPAKAYVIATELHFELVGKEKEYLALSTMVDQLACFIKDQFAAGELPRNFHKLKGYSYKPILKGKNTSKIGQLKPFFRQIAEHPEVFGEAVSRRAQTIFNEDLKD